jgi:uncharacterized protein (TIGR00730 family)
MNEIRSVCVYCGTSMRADPLYQDAAFALGKALAQEGLQLVYGGGKLGLMGQVADGVMQNGGRAIGFTTEYIAHLEQAHTSLTELHVVNSMHTRKLKMSENADAFVILPGGFGTLDELFETLTWRQLKMHDKPIIIANINGYWNPLEALANSVINNLFAQLQDKDYLTFVSSIAEIIPVLKRHPLPKKDITNDVA